MLLTEWNTEDAIAFAREEGREDGLEEGEARGEAKGKTEVARNLLTMQMPIEMIAQAVQMPIEEIHAIAAAG